MLSFGRVSVALLSLASCGVLFGCNTGVKTAVGPKGSHIITCGSGMKMCVTKAESICGDDGYTIIEGKSISRVLGGSSSAYKTKTEVAEMTIRCGVDLIEEEEGGSGKDSYKLPPRADDADLPPEEPIGTKPAPAPAPAAVCTPGSTQKCVGPGACDGGQVCLESGAGYGACDCGGPAPAAPESNSTLEAAPSDDGPQVRVPGAAPEPTPLTK